MSFFFFNFNVFVVLKYRSIFLFESPIIYNIFYLDQVNPFIPDAEKNQGEKKIKFYDWMNLVRYKELFIDVVTRCLLHDIGDLYKAFNAIKIPNLLDMLL